MPQYAVVVWGPSEPNEFDGYESAEERAEQMQATGEFNRRLQAEGRFVYANGLAEASASTVVDGTGDTPIFTDGPYLESKEYMNGLWIIEAADLDEALRLAAEGSHACRRRVEVRPMHGG
jgi:hypothetical protein